MTPSLEEEGATPEDVCAEAAEAARVEPSGSALARFREIRSAAAAADPTVQLEPRGRDQGEEERVLQARALRSLYRVVHQVRP